MHMMQKARPGTEYFTTTENATRILRTPRSRIYKFIKSGKIQAKNANKVLSHLGRSTNSV